MNDVQYFYQSLKNVIDISDPIHVGDELEVRKLTIKETGAFIYVPKEFILQINDVISSTGDGYLRGYDESLFANQKLSITIHNKYPITSSYDWLESINTFEKEFDFDCNNGKKSFLKVIAKSTSVYIKFDDSRLLSYLYITANACDKFGITEEVFSTSKSNEEDMELYQWIFDEYTKNEKV